jgi:Amt family ammonium transporter
MEFAYQHKFSAIGAAMGIVSGLVSITPGCGYVSPMSAVAVSAIGTIAAFFGVRFKTLLSADDVLDVFACHGVGGFAGTVLTGCFASLTQNKNGNDGLFFGTISFSSVC